MGLRQIARSIFSNWFTMAANLAVGFFLSPFIVHHLGNVGYGVWVLAVSSINYLVLLDMGMAGSVVRYVSKGHSTGNHEESSAVASGVLWVRLQIAAVTLAGSGVLAVYFPRMFHIPADLASNARLAVVIIGVTTAVQLIGGTFGAVITAVNRYDLRSVAALVQLIVRVVGVITVLRAGHGMAAIALCELAGAVVCGITLYWFQRKTYPELTLRLKPPSRAVLKEIWSYSFYAFLLTVAYQLVYQSDNLVVGAFISAGAVTFYAIAGSLCRYAQQMVGAMTVTFMPLASGYEASGQSRNLRSLYYNGTRATMVVYLPVVVTFMTRGNNFLGVWMGHQYAGPSGLVLLILSTALLLNLQNSPAAQIVWGIAKHKQIAKFVLPEAIGNFALSMLLARVIGIYGVALGTLIPNLVTSQIMWPRMLSRLMNIRYRELILKVWGPMYLCAAPFAAASYAAGLYLPAHSVLGFFAETLALLPLFALCVALMYREQVRTTVLPRVLSLVHARAGSSHALPVQDESGRRAA